MCKSCDTGTEQIRYKYLRQIRREHLYFYIIYVSSKYIELMSRTLHTVITRNTADTRGQWRYGCQLPCYLSCVTAFLSKHCGRGSVAVVGGTNEKVDETGRRIYQLNSDNDLTTDCCSEKNIFYRQNCYLDMGIWLLTSYLFNVVSLSI